MTATKTQHDRATVTGAARVIQELSGGADPLDLNAVAKLPEMRRPGNRRISVRTLWRWAADGRLEVAKQFGRTVTTRAAVLRTIAADNSISPTNLTSPKQRERELDRIERRLSASGI